MGSPRSTWTATGCLLALPSVALAGMPMIQLTDLARMRVQTISFFLMGFLLSAWLIQRLWNYLQKDFTSLPRLSFGRAAGLTTLWGLLFVLVLTMISGARELMTPGAWKKDGLTYRLADAPTSPQAEPPSTDPPEWEREKKLYLLRDALWRYAKSNNSRFPPGRTVAEIPDESWRLPGLASLHYVYVTGLTADKGRIPLAYEPDLYGPYRFVLLSDGQIRRMQLDEILQSLPAEKR